MKQDRPCVNFEWSLPVGILVSRSTPSSSFEFSWVFIGTIWVLGLFGSYIGTFEDLFCGYIQVSSVDRWVHACVSVKQSV